MGNWITEAYDGSTGLRKETQKKTGTRPKTTETAAFMMEELAVNFREDTFQEIAKTLQQHNPADISEKPVKTS